ncbi:MAG: mannose-6-phosphate isomerase, class I [Spirochaetaceae bacterium]|jgi:mannose-6-phosphate isomerase|nr:mannose-6-phosphate isomerase, class I [Spirochaetaceae bacterium]
MLQIFKLKNKIKPYKWGSPEWIPGLLGHINPQGEPWAELWMGVHPEGPSRVSLQGEDLLLSALISRDPVYYLGEGVNRTFGTLPFLYKLLAADKPLSIQAHPSLEQAKEGWDRENREGLAPDAPDRNYKDPNHKPEILCALSPFVAMCGFRTPGEIRRRLEALGKFCSIQSPLGTALDKLSSALDKPGGLKDFIRLLFGFPREITEELANKILQPMVLEKTHPEFREEWRLSAYFAELYPGDPAVIAPFYLNCITLNPGEAIYLPAGILHAYVHGFGVELMANSDNVLRGGLTSKHMDVDELVHILNFSPFCPEILKPPEPQTVFFNYPVPCREFSLFLREGRGPEGNFAGEGPFIFMVTEGKLTIGRKNQEGKWNLEKGESAFIPAGFAAKGFSLGGTYTLYAAGVGAVDLRAEA